MVHGRYIMIYRTSYYGYLWCTNQLQTGGAPPCTKSMPKFWDLSTGGIPKLNKHIIRLFSHKRWRVNFQRCSAWRHVEKIVQRNIVIFSGQRSRRGLDPSGFFCHRWETTRLEAPFLRWIWSFFLEKTLRQFNLLGSCMYIYIYIYNDIQEHIWEASESAKENGKRSSSATPIFDKFWDLGGHRFWPLPVLYPLWNVGRVWIFQSHPVFVGTTCCPILAG